MTIETSIAALLQTKIGLDIETVGRKHLSRAVARRMVACKIETLAHYFQYLQNPSEMQALIEAVIVPETWFFREPSVFIALRHYLRHLSPIPTVLRFLSLPCATGEEPYSIAIALLEAGFSPDRFRIDGIDISQQCLLKAEAGIYTSNSFRGHFPRQQSYFTTTSEGEELLPYIRKTVSFQQGNLLNFSTPLLPHYHGIFCRNLLIYFGPEERSQALNTLECLLASSGLLYTGVAETAIVRDRFQTTETVGVYRQRESVPKSFLSPTAIAKPKKQLSKKLPFVSPSPISSSSVFPKQFIPSPDPESLLLQSKKLADRGCLEEAIALCKTYLSDNPMSASAYFLLGTLQEAKGNNPPAKDCFAKVLYLEPNHQEALFSLMLLEEQAGNIREVQILKQRLQRIMNPN